jgi:hypothetical protein
MWHEQSRSPASTADSIGETGPAVREGAVAQADAIT